MDDLPLAWFSGPSATPKPRQETKKQRNRRRAQEYQQRYREGLKAAAVAKRREILEKWVPCDMCKNLGIECIPPPLESGRREKCLYCSQNCPAHHCSTARVLFGKDQLVPCDQAAQAHQHAHAHAHAHAHEQGEAQLLQPQPKALQVEPLQPLQRGQQIQQVKQVEQAEQSQRCQVRKEPLTPAFNAATSSRQDRQQNPAEAQAAELPRLPTPTPFDVESQPQINQPPTAAEHFENVKRVKELKETCRELKKRDYQLCRKLTLLTEIVEDHERFVARTRHGIEEGASAAMAMRHISRCLYDGLDHVDKVHGQHADEE